MGIYDTATGAFFLRNANSAGAADLVFTFGPGSVGFVPIVGDSNGDGKDTIGLYDSSSGVFFLRNSNSSGPADITPFGFAEHAARRGRLKRRRDGFGRRLRPGID